MCHNMRTLNSLGISFVIYKVITTIGTERGNSYQNMKRSDETHILTHVNLTETF